MRFGHHGRRTPGAARAESGDRDPAAPILSPAERAEERRRFRKVLVRVLVVQVISVLLLWALQARYTIG